MKHHRKKKSTKRSTSAADTPVVSAAFAAMPPPPHGALTVAILLSLALHAFLLTLHFQFPEASRAFQEKALDIILVNSKSVRKPTEAQALAQTNLDGGGTTDENRRTKTPLPPSAKQAIGSELEQTQRRVRELEARQKRLLAEANSIRTAPPGTDSDAKADPSPGVSGVDLATSALAMARFEGEIARSVDEYNKRPRVKHLGTRAEEYRYAQYMEDWRLKVERVGTLNYPEAAKGKLYGSLRLSVRIASDGSVASVEVDQSSGHRILDEAAKRIVQLASPFAAFPPDIRRDVDFIDITRTWAFTSSNQLETKNR